MIISTWTRRGLGHCHVHEQRSNLSLDLLCPSDEPRTISSQLTLETTLDIFRVVEINALQKGNGVFRNPERCNATWSLSVYCRNRSIFLAFKGAQYNNTSLVPCSGVNIPATFAEYDGYMRNCMGAKNTCGNEWVQKETWAYNQQKDLKALSFETSLYDLRWML